MSDVITRSESDEMMKIIKGLREKAEKISKESSEFKAYQEKAEEDLKKFDEKIEAFIKEEATQRKEKEELLERVKQLEIVATTAKTEGDLDKVKAAHDAMNAITKKEWLKFADKNPVSAKHYMDSCLDAVESGIKDLPSDAKAFERAIVNYKATNDLMRTDIGEVGGFLCPIEWSAELLRQIIETSPIRSFARVTGISSKGLRQPVRQGVPTATWEGEAEEGEDGTSNYIQEEMTPHRLTITIPITWDMLNDNAYNVSNELMADSRISFSQAEGVAFVSGDAIKKPLGFTTDPDVPIYSSATNTLSFDDMISVTGELKSGYNAAYGFNRRTLVYLRLLKDNDDRYIWSGPFGDGAAGPGATINGYRYSSEFIDMDDYDVNDGFPVVFADFFRFYRIVDRTSMIVIRDEYTRKKEAVVEFTFMRWTDGMPVMKEAGILLKKIA